MPEALRGLLLKLTSDASALGHGSFAITAKHYVDRDALRNSSVRRVVGTLGGDARDEVEGNEALLARLRALSPDERRALLQIHGRTSRPLNRPI